MNPLDTARSALTSLWASKLRSSLTVLGIVIGVAAVISLMSIGRGAQASITEMIQSLGTNLLFVQPGASSFGGIFFGQGSASTLTLEDAEAIADLLQDHARRHEMGRLGHAYVTSHHAPSVVGHKLLAVHQRLVEMRRDGACP